MLNLSRNALSLRKIKVVGVVLLATFLLTKLMSTYYVPYPSSLCKRSIWDASGSCVMESSGILESLAVKSDR